MWKSLNVDNLLDQMWILKIRVNSVSMFLKKIQTTKIHNHIPLPQKTEKQMEPKSEDMKQM